MCIPLGLCGDDRESLLDLMKKVGGPVEKMDPENIVMIVRAGSYLYNLSTPESDVDYLVVYIEPTQVDIFLLPLYILIYLELSKTE